MNIDEFVTKEKFDEFRNVDNFDNNSILKNRWNEVDELLSTFYSKNQKINRRMYDNLQDVFDTIKFSYEELNNYGSIKDIAKLRRKIDEIKEEYGLDGYAGYTLNQYLKRKKLTNRELLLTYIILQYYKQLKEQNKDETILFDEIKNVIYKQETKRILIIYKQQGIEKKPKDDMSKVNWLDILMMIGYNGYKWLDYKEGNIIYNANKLIELISIKMQQGKELNVDDTDISKLLNKQEKAYLYMPEKEIKEDVYVNQFSGSLDNQIATLTNRIALQVMKDYGVKKVQFIAVIDDKTTKMCKSLDKKIFNIDDINAFSRYSALSQGEVIYHTRGLELGVNLPPINDHFHYCRSTIIPYV